MRSLIAAMATAVALTIAVPAPSAAQGQGQGKPDRPNAQNQKEKERGPDRAAPPGQARAQGQGQGQDKARGQGQRGGPPAHARGRRGGPAPDVATYNRNLLSRATEARARRHGNDRRVTVRREGGEVRVARDDGTLLFALDQGTAEELGYWRMSPIPGARETPRRTGDRGIFDGIGDDEAREAGGSPSFCRSGEGHPVWGREWCQDKGFGIGEGNGRLWARATDLEDVVLRRPETRRTELDRGGLIDILGDVVFGRLAVQSLVLGADQPLTGRWIGQDDGPRVLRVRAGDIDVAELVDGDRDDQVDVLLVNLGS